MQGETEETVLSDKSNKNKYRGNKNPWRGRETPSGDGYFGYGDDEDVSQLAGQVGLGFLKNSSAFMKRFVLAQVLGAPKSLELLQRNRNQKVGDGGQQTGQQTVDGAGDGAGDGAERKKESPTSEREET